MQLVGIRCSSIGMAEDRLHAHLTSLDPSLDIRFILDARLSRSHDSRAINFDDNDITRWGLLCPADWGWRCGDYFLYAMQDFCFADFYWLIEPDVYFGVPEKFNIFKETDLYRSDFISVFHGSRGPDWAWYKTISPFFPNVGGCTFPLSRSSHRFVSAAKKARMMLTRVFENDQKLWPNDESFLSSLALSTNFTANSFDKIFPKLFKKFSAKDQFLYGPALANCGVVHPALDFNDFKVKFRKRYESARTSGRLDVFIKNSFDGLNAKMIEELITPL